MTDSGNPKYEPEGAPAPAKTQPTRSDFTNESGKNIDGQLDSFHADRSLELDHGDNTIPDSRPTVNRAPSSRFQIGSRLLNRFEIIRYIARGGMGEVYEVVDHVVRRNMALKTVLPEAVRDPRVVEQIKQEINNARNVTHPNVCRVFEVFEDGEIPPGYLLTMELLEGETLAEILRRDGPMQPEQLLPIARQMAAGLEAVHKAGIVHQDFKTSNVMIVEADGEQRVVVTDFGLAMDLRAKNGDQGMGGGTPAYMAPEQVKRKAPIDKRADIYAFGVVLYELLTKHFPIPGETATEVMQNKLTVEPLPPSLYSRKLPAHWERAILRCLEIDPGKRFSNVDEVIAALEQRAERRRRRLMAIGISAVVLIALAGVGGAIARRWMITHRTPTVAFVGLVNQGDPGTNWLGTELAESLSGNLAESKDINVVPQDDVALVKGEFPVTSGPDLEREDLAGFRQAIAADYLVIGHYKLVDAAAGQIQLDLKLQGPRGETVGDVIHEEGTEAEFRKLVSHAARQIRKNLGSTLLPEMEADEAANVYPSNSQARRLYFDALSQLRSLNSVAALEGLRSAAKIEDANAAIHAAAAEAFVLQKSFGEARLEAQRAEDIARNSPLPRENVMLIEARAAEISNDWSSAIQRLDALYQLSRDKMRYGLLLAGAQVQSMRSDDALVTLSALKKLPKPAGDDPRILITEAEAHSVAGRYPDEVVSATNALEAARSRKWRLMEANANLELCWAQQRVQNSQAAMVACNQAETLFKGYGDPVNAAVVLNNIANWQVQRGNLEEAKQAYESVLSITTNAQDKVDTAGAHLNLAGTLLRLNDLEASSHHVTQALELAYATGDAYDQGRAHLIRADILRATSTTKEAIAEAQLALDVATKIDDRDTEANAWNDLSLFRRQIGDPDGALEATSRALALRRELQDKSGIAASLEQYGDISFEEGDLLKARQYYNDAISQRDPAEKAALAQLWLSLATVEAETGDYASGMNHAWQASEEYRAEKDDESRVDALATLVQIASAAKQLDKAGTLVRELEAAKPQDQEVQDDVMLARAAYALATDNPKQAISLLASNSESADSKTYSEINRRLVLAHALWANGDRSKARIELGAIRRDATKAGFKLLARKAAMSASR